MKTREAKLRKKFVRRAMRVRKNLRGTSLKPRLCVVKSNRHIEAQLIDDEQGITIASTSSKQKDFRSTEYNRRNKATAKQLGQKLAEEALEKNVKEVVFDRGPFKYHGILAEFADAARGAGLKF
jgi:large subunit ribosomal protein L18